MTLGCSEYAEWRSRPCYKHGPNRFLTRSTGFSMVASTTHISYGKMLVAVFSLGLAVGCVPLDDGYNSPSYGNGYGGGYNRGPYYGNSGGYHGDPYYRDPYYRDERRDAQRERERLEQERERLEEERRRLERERQRDRYPNPPPPPAARPQPERCPPGFSPSENKCSPEERKRGCKDIRMPSGLGCVHR